MGNTYVYKTAFITPVVPTRQSRVLLILIWNIVITNEGITPVKNVHNEVETNASFFGYKNRVGNVSCPEGPR